MCMFMAMAEVRGTEIFATRYAGRQVLVYGAKVETRERNAMVLPIPVASRGTRVELLDLSAAPRFFLALRDYYMPQEIPGYGPPPALGAPAAVLEVFTVGSYEASIVPSLDDFGRLDVRFRLTSGLQQVLAERYGDWAFVVYQMAAGKHELHPFGVAFESRFSGHLFFPTVHVHDGGHAPRTAQFAHQFYAQGARLMSRHDPPHVGLPPPPPPFGGLGPPPFRRRPVMPSFVDLDRPLDYGTRFGVLANADVFALLDG